MNYKKIKTVVVINDFVYTQGGASKVAINTANILKDTGVKVYFFSALKDGEEKKGIEYITTNQVEAIKDKNKIRGVINGIYNIRASKTLKKLLKKLDNSTTIIHIHGWTKILSSSIFSIAFKMGFKVVLTLHDYFLECPNGGIFNYQKNEVCQFKPLSKKCIFCNCDSRNYIFKIYRLIRQFVQNRTFSIGKKLKYIICVSEFSEKIMEQFFSEMVKVVKINNPINTTEIQEMRKLKENQYFLYVGRIEKVKGIETFCKAVSEIGEKGIIVGNGQDKEYFENKYKEIQFVGWKDEKEVKEYMEKAKALIFPSIGYETAGLTVLEAQAVGTPCFVRKGIAACEFIIGNKDDYTFSSIEELKQKMTNMVEKEINFEEIKKYNYENYKIKLLKFYEEVINDV